MLQEYLEYLNYKTKKFSKEKDIIDIIVYGSITRGKEKPNDTDIIIIFKETPLKERMIKAQELKELIKEKITNSDIKTINLKEFLEEEFLSRQGIITEGISILDKKSLAEKLGFSGITIFTYKLKNLDHTKKTRFTYALIGRNSEGMIKITGAKPLGKGAIEVPIKNSEIFEEFLEEWGVEYKKTKGIIEK